MPTGKDQSTGQTSDQNMEGFISADQQIDVAEIMESIKERIAEKKDSGVLRQTEIDDIVDMELLPLPDFLEVPNTYENHLYPEIPKPERPPIKEFHAMEFKPEVEEGSGIKGLIKKIMIKYRKLMFPLVRFMSRPIYNELKQLTIDKFNYNAHAIHHNTHEIECTPAEILFNRHILFQSKEYIKLMHNSMNNLIVELSKTKIEQELLKTKIKVMEDKIEFLENRERAIEKKLFTVEESTPKTKKKTASKSTKTVKTKKTAKKSTGESA